MIWYKNSIQAMQATMQEIENENLCLTLRSLYDPQSAKSARALTISPIGLNLIKFEKSPHASGIEIMMLAIL